MASERLQAGTLLGGRYEIEAAVGSGGMGAVYRARDTRLHSVVAVKELRDRYDTEEERAESIRHFEREARLLAQLSHPNLPRVSDYFIEQSRCYLVMEFIEGETLEARLRREEGRGLPLLPALEWGVQLADALNYLHTQDPPIVFRDLKPANIMITAEGSAKLIDFGIARRFHQGATKDTLLYGSPGYSPPEQYGRAQTDPRADIYALGATLHHLLTGRDPAPTPFKFPPIRTINPSLPPALDLFVQRSVEMDESRRIQSAQEARDTLARIRDEMRARTERFSGQAESGLSPRRPGAAGLAAAAVIVVFLVVLGSVWIRQQRKEPVVVPPAVTPTPQPTGPPPEPAPAQPGKIRIESDPTGATVFVDGVEVGKTPAEIDKVEAGSHALKVVPAEGSGRAEWTRNVEVKPGETLVLDAQLPEENAESPPDRTVVQLLNVQVTPAFAPNPRNAQPGLYFDLSFRVSGASGRSGSAAAFFYMRDGKTPLPAVASAGPFRNPEGQLNVAHSIQVEADPAEFKNLVLFIPESEFQIRYTHVSWRFVLHLDGQQVYQSDPAPIVPH